MSIEPQPFEIRYNGGSDEKYGTDGIGPPHELSMSDVRCRLQVA